MLFRFFSVPLRDGAAAGTALRQRRRGQRGEGEPDGSAGTHVDAVEVERPKPGAAASSTMDDSRWLGWKSSWKLLCWASGDAREGLPWAKSLMPEPYPRAAWASEGSGTEAKGVCGRDMVGGGAQVSRLRCTCQWGTAEERRKRRWWWRCSGPEGATSGMMKCTIWDVGGGKGMPGPRKGVQEEAVVLCTTTRAAGPDRLERLGPFFVHDVRRQRRQPHAHTLTSRGSYPSIDTRPFARPCGGAKPATTDWATMTGHVRILSSPREIAM